MEEQCYLTLRFLPRGDQREACCMLQDSSYHKSVRHFLPLQTAAYSGEGQRGGKHDRLEDPLRRGGRDP